MEHSESGFFEMNRAGWDQLVEVHARSRFYDVDGFLAGALSLREIELAELQNVAGKRLLHLQCHFGLDTLSWARKGAVCTGVDFSSAAIQKARTLSATAGLHARFVCSDVYGFRATADGPFDIVFTSYGSLCWLPDLDRWAAVVAENLAAGGEFYMVEFHPVHDLLTGYSYFERAEPDIDVEGTYTENGADTAASFATWTHGLSNVLNALTGARIGIERVSEFPFSPYRCFENMVEREPGRFFVSHQGNDVPLVYSVRGRKLA